jgi:hypothetical protein
MGKRRKTKAVLKEAKWNRSISEISDLSLFHFRLPRSFIAQKLPIKYTALTLTHV